MNVRPGAQRRLYAVNPAPLAEHDGAYYVLRFERRMEHPPAEVWDAIATPDGIRGWLGEARLDRTEGGAVRLQFDKTVGNVVEGRVPEVRPPHMLEYTFGQDDSVLRWELSAAGAGATLLVLTHRLPRSAGHLPETLAGEDPSWSKERWDEVRASYGPVQEPA